MDIRRGLAQDLEQINAIYNHYILTSHCTFDVAEHSMAWRAQWFERFLPQGRHRLFVAEGDAGVEGYVCSMPFRDKAAYATSVEVSIYVAHSSSRRGIATALYDCLFDALAGEQVHRAYAGITLPNDASVALHERFGFHRAALFTEQGNKFDAWWDVAWYEKAVA